MRQVKGSTKFGQQLIAKGMKWEGDYLSQIYNSCSEKKRVAFDWCREQYYDTPDHDAWGICTHNTWGFSVSWVGTHNGESIMRLETPNNSYMIFLDR